MRGEMNRDHIQSIERCMAVIEAFTGQTGGMSFSQLAAATGLSKPSVRRILLTLEALGYATSSGSRFALTPKTLGLGYAYLSSLSLTSIARPLMEALTDELGESTALTALDGSDIIYLDRVHRHRISGITLVAGTRLPAHATSSGHVLLADLKREALATYFAKAKLTALTDRTLTSEEQIIRRLEIVRARGWDFVDQELEIGRLSAAAPIRDPRGAVVAALSLSCESIGQKAQQIVDEYVPRLEETTSEISAALGGNGYVSHL